MAVVTLTQNVSTELEEAAEMGFETIDGSIGEINILGLISI